MRLNDLTGQRFGRLTVVRRAPNYTSPAGHPRSRFECVCDCGNTTVVHSSSLSGGSTVSCGCFHLERVAAMGRASRTHGMHNSSTYVSWAQMRQRCANPKCSQWANYGGRGISVCERWLHSFESFLEDMGVRPDGCTIDRIDVEGNYEPSNCRWATAKEQAANKRLCFTEQRWWDELEQRFAGDSEKLTAVRMLKAAT